MLAYVILLSLIATFQVSLTQSHQSLEFKDKRDDSFELPSNYSLSGTLKTTYTPERIVYSPDQNWIVYNTYWPGSTNVIYFRNRRMQELSSEKQVKIPNSHSIKSFAFSQSGDLLFVGTSLNFVYVCKFSGRMQDEDCQKNIFLTFGGAVMSMITNSFNKIACMAYGQILWIVNFNNDGDMALEYHISFSDSLWTNVMWHPKAQKDTLIISRVSYRLGIIMLYNINTNQTYDLSTQTTQFMRINVLRDGQTLLASYADNGDNKIIQYKLQPNKVTEVGTVNEDSEIFWTSITGNIVAGYNSSSKQKYFIWSVSFTTNSTESINVSAISNSSIVTLNQLYHFDSFQNHATTFSTDLNNLLIDSSKQIFQFSLCLGNTYFSEIQCLKCSPVCQSCHISPDLCFQCIDNTFALIKNGSCVKCSTLLDGCLSCSNSSSCSKCIDNTFALMNQSCLKCSSVLDGCLTCSTPSFCTLCDYQKNWNALPQNGSCVCQDFYFISQGQCKPCDSSGACRTCTSQSQCTQCDLYKGYKEKPVDSKCVCRRQFSSVNQKCVECDIEGCERCEKANVCLSCSEENGYESDAGSNGECIKKSSSWIIVVWSIIGGCSILLASIYVYCKCKGKRKFQRNELKEKSSVEDQGYKQILSGGSMDHERASVKRESVPRFEQIEQILRQSIKKQIKVGVPIAAVNKKEYAKFSDAQKIMFRQLLHQSTHSNQ